MEKIVLKTEAKTVRGILEAIINAHLIVNDIEFADMQKEVPIVSMYHRDAVKMILDKFIVIPKADYISKQDEVVKQLEKCVKESKENAEGAHIDADEILCKFLISLGYDKVAETFDNVRKWYS